MEYDFNDFVFVWYIIPMLVSVIKTTVEVCIRIKRKRVDFTSRMMKSFLWECFVPAVNLLTCCACILLILCQISDWVESYIRDKSVISMIIEDGRNRGKAYEASLRLRFLELIGRRTGRTTRLVDRYIQELYRKLGEWVHIRDHSYTRQDDSLLERNILRRMEIEHQEDKIERRHHNGRIELRIVSCPSKDEIARGIASVKNALHEMGVDINEDDFCV